MSHHSVLGWLVKSSNHIYLVFSISVYKHAGQPIQISDMERGIKCRQGNRFSRGLRQPITVLRMQQILQHLRISSFLPRDRQLWWSAITLAFFGLLRYSDTHHKKFPCS